MGADWRCFHGAGCIVGISSMSPPSRIPASRRRALPLLLGAAALAVALGACAPRIDVRGYTADPDALAEIEPGVQTASQVAALLGTPTVVSTFDERRWYYIMRRTETTSFYTPELAEQQIVAVSFDEDDVVAEVAFLGAEEARAIHPVSVESPVRGRDLSLFQQLFGNIGRPAASNR